MVATELQKDAIRELMNISVGRAAGMLNTLITKHLTLFVPESKLIISSEIEPEISHLNHDTLSCVTMPFKNGLSGSAKMIFPWADAEKLVNLFSNENLVSDNFEEVRAAILSEIGNIVLNSLMGTLSNLFNYSLKYQVPSYSEGWFNTIFELDNIDDNSIVLIAKTQFLIDDLKIFGDLLIFIELNSFELLIEKIEYFAQNYGSY